MATIREIAALAGVSIATVSKVLNNKSGVKQETADTILHIADSLNYRPNLSARSLKLGDARTIGIITEDLTVFNTPEIVDGVACLCDEQNYHYILSNLRFNKRADLSHVDHPQRLPMVHAAVDDLLSKQVAGIIYVGCHSHSVQPFQAYASIPVVCAYCTCQDNSTPCVVYDDEMGAYDATRTLFPKAEGPIGMITGPVDSVHMVRRTSGFVRALSDANLPYDPSLVRVGDWSRDSGYRLGGELIDLGVRTLFVQNDIMAVGVVDWCAQNNIQVGKDLFLIGFDNRELSAVCHPSLSTVSLPLFEMGQAAASILVDLLSGKEPEQKNTMLECSIIQRESSGGPQ